jgi:hypothetical protein
MIRYFVKSLRNQTRIVQKYCVPVCGFGVWMLTIAFSALAGFGGPKGFFAAAGSMNDDGHKPKALEHE